MTDLPNERTFGAVFPNEEYDTRRAKVRQRMADRGIDVLYVSSPRNITYLTGFDIIWFYHASPTGLVIRADDPKVLFFDSYHERMVNDFCYIDEAVFYATFPFHPMGPQLDTVIDTMKDRGPPQRLCRHREVGLRPLPRHDAGHGGEDVGRRGPGR